MTATKNAQARTTTITEMEHRTAHSHLAGDRDGIYAVVNFADGSSYELSRLDGETNWTVDASWGKGSFPHWVNGYGARYLITKFVTDEGLVAKLNARACPWKMGTGDCTCQH